MSIRRQYSWEVNQYTEEELNQRRQDQTRPSHSHRQWSSLSHL